MRTGTIKYNVKARGRQFRGQDRNFDTVMLAQVVNGPEVQERVKNRDLVGYFGHWPRVAFGMNPGEGGIYKGKQVSIEAALVTTSLRADLDGNIEHEAEFLDTAPGRTAKRLFSSKAGGFSSAINCREHAGRDVPIGFYGFDYVMEPNFTTNRGYALDGVADDSGLVLDDAMREGQATIRVLDGLYNELQADYDRMAQAMAVSQAECAELVAMLAKRPQHEQDGMKHKLARLDSAFVPGWRGATRTGGLLDLAREFSTMELAGFEPATGPAEAAAERVLANLVTGFFSKAGR